MLHPNYLRQIFDYNPDTGVLTWKISRNRMKAGDVAGSVHPQNGVYVSVDGQNYKSSLIIWAMMHNYWPTKIVDHKDRNPFNNRLDNLREATRTENNQNKGIYRTNSTGHPGVWFNKKLCKYQANIQVNKQRIHLGFFPTIEEAIEARREAEKAYFKEFVRSE